MRALLVALGLHAHQLAFGRGFALRSGAELRPRATTVTWLGDDGDESCDLTVPAPRTTQSDRTLGVCGRIIALRPLRYAVTSQCPDTHGNTISRPTKAEFGDRHLMEKTASRPKRLKRTSGTSIMDCRLLRSSTGMPTDIPQVTPWNAARRRLPFWPSTSVRRETSPPAGRQWETLLRFSDSGPVVRLCPAG